MGPQLAYLSAASAGYHVILGAIFAVVVSVLCRVLRTHMPVAGASLEYFLYFVSILPLVGMLLNEQPMTPHRATIIVEATAFNFALTLIFIVSHYLSKTPKTKPPEA